MQPIHYTALFTPPLRATNGAVGARGAGGAEGAATAPQGDDGGGGRRGEGGGGSQHVTHLGCSRLSRYPIEFVLLQLHMFAKSIDD